VLWKEIERTKKEAQALIPPKRKILSPQVAEKSSVTLTTDESKKNEKHSKPR
jgi:hypothetical protein